MENQENNNLSELDQLKAQYETLKQQFDQQEIVNDRLMKSSIKHSADFYRRYRWLQIVLYPLAAIIGLLVIKWLLDNNLSARLFWVTFCVVCFAIELLMTRKLYIKTLENNDLLALSNHARNYKKLFSVFTILNYSTGLILTFGVLGKEIRLPSMTSIFVVTGFLVLFFVFLGISEIRYKTRPCDEIIRQIEVSETPMDKKKTGFGKKQKWFCMAMIAVFLGFDIWAYTIVAPNRTVTYKRTNATIVADDQLSVWEIYADTLVAPDDVAAVTEQWQQDSSLVVMREKESTATIALDETSVHEWKEDEGPQVKLYALKMTSPEGPIISSARIGGKPVLEKIVVQEPRFDKKKWEIIPVNLYLSPEASQLWEEYAKTDKEEHWMDVAVVVDGEVYQQMHIGSLQGVVTNKFFIWRPWEKDELKEFCNRLIKK